MNPPLSFFRARLRHAVPGLCLTLLAMAATAAESTDVGARNPPARAQAESGSPEAALTAAQRALVDGENQLGGESVHLVPLLNQVGDRHRALNMPAPALHAYQRAADLLSKAGKTVSPDMARVMFDIASARLDAEDFVGAASDFAKVVDIRDMLPASAERGSAEAFLNLGYCHVRLKHHVIASLFYDRALEIERRSASPDVRTQVAALTALGSIHRQRERFSESQVLYRQALAFQEKWLGPTHLDLAATLTGLGLLFEDQEKYTEAEAAYLRAVEIAEAAGAEGEAALHSTLTQLMGLYRDRRDDTNVSEVARRLAALDAKRSPAR